MNRPVKIKRLGDGIDSYVLTISGPVTRMIHINSHEELVSIYEQGHELGETLRNTDNDTVWNINGEQITLNWHAACGLFATVEDWFWDLADTAESRFVA